MIRILLAICLGLLIASCTMEPIAPVEVISGDETYEGGVVGTGIQSDVDDLDVVVR